MRASWRPLLPPLGRFSHWTHRSRASGGGLGNSGSWAEHLKFLGVGEKCSGDFQENFKRNDAAAFCSFTSGPTVFEVDAAASES